MSSIDHLPDGQSNHSATIDPDTTFVYLVRHGETSWNLEKRFQGQLDIPLSETGEEQARAVARWIAGRPEHFSAIYSSDLERAAGTARQISEAIGLRVSFTRELRELHCGSWQGLSGPEIETRFPGQLQRWHEHVESFTLPGGESIPSLQKRILAFYDEVVEHHRGEAIIVVSHGAALSSLLIALRGWRLEEAWHTRQTRMGNTGVTIVAHDHSTSQREVVLFNSSEHLPEPPSLSSVLDNPGKPAAV